MVFSKPKELSDMTIDEAKKVLTDKNVCASCSDCLSHQDNWKGVGGACSDVARKAFEIITSRLEELEKELEKGNQDANQSIPNALSYEQTIDFMKSRGYTHCYMCGASLNKK